MKMLEKLQKRLQEGKKDNKGFSLVELIIVIAIMAILVGIVGMTVIPQIENSRKATDEQVLSALVTEAMESYTQAVYGSGKFTLKITVKADGSFDQISVTPNGGTAVTCAASAAASSITDTSDAGKLLKKFVELGSNGSRKLKSNAGKALTTNGITIELDDTIAPPIVLTADGFEKIEVR